MVQTLLGKDLCKSIHFSCSDIFFCQKVRGIAIATPPSDVESVVISYGIVVANDSHFSCTDKLFCPKSWQNVEMFARIWNLLEIFLYLERGYLSNLHGFCD